MPTEKSLLRPLLLLIGISLCLGIYKAATLHCISNDAVGFLQFADQLQTAPGEAIQSGYQHPGFPALILLAEQGLHRLSGPLSLYEKIAAGQSVNLLCRTVAIGFVFAGFLSFTGRKKAFVMALLVLLIPAYADNGSDVLSDWPNLMFMSIAFFVCLKGLSRPSPGWFLLAGVASGLAYWIRPEGLMWVAVAAVFGALQILRTSQKGKWLACLCLMILAAGVITAPYMYYKGAIFPKKNIGTFSGAPDDSVLSADAVDRTARSPDALGRKRPPQPNRVSPGFRDKLVRSAWALPHFAIKSFNALFLLSIPLAAIVIRQLASFRRRRKQDQLLALFIGFWLLVMIWLYGRTGYMSDRHLMPMLVFACAWLDKGLLLLALLCCRQQVRRNAVILLVLCTVIFIPKLIRTIRPEKAVYKQAGRWLSENTPEDAQLAVFDNRIGFYAQRTHHRARLYRRFGCRYLILKPSDQTISIPARASIVETGDPVMDEAMIIYDLRGHQD